VGINPDPTRSPPNPHQKRHNKAPPKTRHHHWQQAKGLHREKEINMPSTHPKTGQADNTTIPHNSTTPQALATPTSNSPSTTNQPAHHRNQNQPQPHQGNPATTTMTTTSTPQPSHRPNQNTKAKTCPTLTTNHHAPTTPEPPPLNQPRKHQPQCHPKSQPTLSIKLIITKPDSTNSPATLPMKHPHQ